MNRHSQVFTAQKDIDTVLMGPFSLTTHLVEKHKFSILAHNFGQADLHLTPQYFANAAWHSCQGVDGATPTLPMPVVAQAEKTLDFMFEAGTQFRIIGHGDGAATEGRIEMIECDFESNLNDR